MRLTFGKIVGDEGEQVYDANWYFGWPVPIGQVIKVPINTRTININTAFWHEISDRDTGIGFDQLLLIETQLLEKL